MLSTAGRLGAAGWLAMAASGLLLPSWLADEAAANDHHHRRHQQRRRRTQKRRKSIRFKDVAFDVTNDLDEHIYHDTWYRFNQFWDATLFGVDTHAQKCFARMGSTTW